MMNKAFCKATIENSTENVKIGEGDEITIIGYVGNEVIFTHNSITLKLPEVHFNQYFKKDDTRPKE